MTSLERRGIDGRSRLINHVFLFLFALSGAAALIYEVIWVRQFIHILGATSYAVTIILTTFMAGLGLGAWFFGKKADGFSTGGLARTYILLETGIGCYALILPFLLGWTETLYVGFCQVFEPGPMGFNGMRLGMAFMLLIIPATFMGGTLPVMGRYLIRRNEQIALTISRLYALNTFGAVLGVMCAGYFFLPRFGVALTSVIAVTLNFGVAAVFWFVNFTISSIPDSVAEAPVTVDTPSRETTPLQKAVLAGFCVSGIAAMLYEVAWTRILSMILGTTTFAFTTMLCAFLLGIAMGSALYGFIRRIVSGPMLFISLQFVSAFSVLLTIPLFEKLPFVFLSVHEGWIDTWVDMQFARFILALSVMLIPTVAMGTLLPAVSSIFVEKTGHLGRRVGRAYGLNTLGNVVGAAVGGLLLVPLLGMQKAIMLGAFLNMTAACFTWCFLYDSSRIRRGLGIAAGSLATLLLIWIIEPWAPRIMNSGVYVYASRYLNMLDRYDAVAERRDHIPELPSWGIMEMAMKQYELLYYHTGITATVAVMERKDGVRFLTVDGKTDAGSGEKSDMQTQVMIAQLPLLFHKDPDNILVVGLGSGVTAGSVLSHDVRVVDCAEISPSVVEAAGFFSEVNGNALNDKRLRIIQRDARNLLLTSEERYDVIISQPSNPWISGESDLFSLEWYQLVHEQLRDGGLFLQWAPSYLMSGRALKVIVHTLRSVFPNITVWSSGSVGDLIFLAKKGGPLRVDYNMLMERLSRNRVRNDILRIGQEPALLPFDLFVMNSRELSEYLYADLQRPLRKNTDNLLITEFSTPRQLVRQNRISRFIDPQRLHGDLKSLMGILKNVKIEDLRRLLKQRFSTAPKGI